MTSLVESGNQSINSIQKNELNSSDLALVKSASIDVLDESIISNENNTTECFSNNLKEVLIEKACSSASIDLEEFDFEVNKENVFDMNKEDCYNMRYKLPYIEPASELGRALCEKRDLKKKLLGTLLSTITSDIEKNSLRMKRGYLNEVIRELLNTYPYLKKNMPFRKAEDVWRKTFHNKFSNDRREKKEKPAKKPKVDETRIGNLYDIPMYFPQISPNEIDETTNELYLESLQKEFYKIPLDFAAIRHKMSRTFVRRRRFLMGSQANAQEFLKLYPCLRLEKEFVWELTRIFDGKNHLPDFCRLKTKLLPAVVADSHGSHSHMKSYVERLFICFSAEQAEKVSNFQFLGYLSVLLQEKPNFLMGTELPIDEKYEGTPFILFDGLQASLLINGISVLENFNCENAVFYWVSAYLVFDLRVPKYYRKLYSSLMEIIYDMPAQNEKSSLAFKLRSIVLKSKQ